MIRKKYLNLSCVFLFVLFFSRIVVSISIAVSSSGNVIISIYDDENHYEITPAQIGAKVITEVKYLGVSSNINWGTGFVQQVYHFQFISPQENLKVNIWEHDKKVTVEHDPFVAPKINFKKVPCNGIEFYRTY